MPKVIAPQMGISIQAVYKFIRLKGLNETVEFIETFENVLSYLIEEKK